VGCHLKPLWSVALLRILMETYWERTFNPPLRTRVCEASKRVSIADGKWGLQDEAGRVLVKAEHDLLTCFSLGTAFVPDYELKQWCPIDREGQRRSDLPCKDYMYTGAPSHHAPEKLDPDPWLSNLKWIRQNYEYGLGLREDKPKFIRW